MDYYEQKYRNSGPTYRICWYMFIGIIVLLFACTCFSGCKSIQYVPVETVRTDTLWQKIVERDSIILSDSVIVREKGDTVMIEKWHTKYRDRLKTDTMYVSKIDSVQVPYPIEKKLTRWETFCIDYGKVMLGASVILLAFVIIWLVRKIKGKGVLHSVVFFILFEFSSMLTGCL